jgi:NAD(P)-dependent dehydrogenase (short-subunit alcohol dehydrogenase family)
MGLQIAKDYLDEGARVLITSRSADHLKTTAESLNSPNLYTLQWDVADVAVTADRLKEAHALIGPIDIFVNNAGIYKHMAWDQETPENYDRVNGVNARGLFFMCQQEGQYMVANHIHGNIVNITSIAGLKADFDDYSVSKWSAVCITKGLAKILIQHDIVVNGIAPGNVVTNIHEGYKGVNVHENSFTPRHLSKRYVLVEEISSMVLYLSSGAARNIVGHVIPVDGGWADF